jgi:hypothetical protein
MIKKIYFWFQFLLGLLFLGVGIFGASCWIWDLTFDPDGRMPLSWEFYIPEAFLSVFICLELGLYVLYKLFRNDFFKRMFKGCNYLLMLGSAMLIIFFFIMGVENGFLSDFFDFLFNFIIIAIPTLIFTITYKLNRTLHAESNN